MNELPEHEIGQMLARAVPPLREPADRLGEIRARVRRARLGAGAAAAGGVTVAAAFALAVVQLLPGSTGPALVAADGRVQYEGNALVVELPGGEPRVCVPAPVAPLVDDGNPPRAQGADDSGPLSLTPASSEPSPTPDNGGGLAPFTGAVIGDAPDCQGPPNEITNWDWSAVAADSSDDGARWGSYFLVGVWDGERFSLTEPARPTDGSFPWPHSLGADPNPFESPCPEPPGGWQAVDPGKATPEALSELTGWAERQPEFGGMWVYSWPFIEEPGDTEADVEAEFARNQVVNLRFTGDPADWETQIREIWGGPLCVLEAERTMTELTEIQATIDRELPYPAVVSTSQSPTNNAVLVEALFADPELQRDFDQRFGVGAVIVYGWLRPVS